jgi:hypothetical protein
MCLKKFLSLCAGKKLTQEEKNALSDYKTGSAAISLFLRFKKISKEDLPDVISVIRLLDSAICKTKLNKSTFLFRGTSIGEIENKRVKFITYTPGFVSTSTSEDVAAKKFASLKKEEAAILRIKVKKGQHGVYLSGKAIWARAEEEVLLGRGSVFIIKREEFITDVNRINNILGDNNVKLLKIYTLVIIKNRCLNHLLKNIINKIIKSV